MNLESKIQWILRAKYNEFREQNIMNLEVVRVLKLKKKTNI